MALVAILVAALGCAEAATLRWSSQGDFLSADPHAQNEGVNNNINDYVYERLTARDRKLGLVPSLATSWELRAPGVWRFHLRKGVTFHDGSPFTADDVVFSLGRAMLPSSNFKVYAGPVSRVRKVDAHTVEIETPLPAAVMHDNLTQVRIMSRAWCEKHRATVPQDFKTGEETFASRHANGTGPFILEKREAEVATTLVKNPKWWGIAEKRFEGNVERIVYRPIASGATRMAALVSGELDLVLDPQLQDIPRLRTDPKLRIVEGPENRVIFLAMDQKRDELRHSDVKGRNPLKDLRVRRALYHAIDVQGIQRQVMRGLSVPTGAMTSAVYDASLEPRLVPHDPAKARALLAEAGYPNGFEVGLLCPNNRYVNDERICTAIAGMFAKAGVKVRLEAIPRAQFFQRVDQFDFSMHLYGWGGAVTDPGFTLGPVLRTKDGKGRGDFNSGQHSDAELDRISDAAEQEHDPAKRRELLLAGLRRTREQVFTIPLHRQVIPWAVRANVTAVHRPDNVVDATWVRID
jgi:peptide/nickel transport system substrate-binding protein